MAKGIPDWAKALGDTLIQVVQSSPPAQAVRDGTPRRVAEQLGQWMGHLSKHAAVKWGPAMLGRELCSFCEEDALGRCISCGDYTCIGHAHVSYRAELLCDECVGTVVESVGQRRDNPVDKAFAHFHLTPEATKEEVEAAYRQRTKTAHPDRGGSTQEQQQTNNHYRVLRSYFDRKAA